ncbi:MAG: BlaI/MecI/CopY family transcriptional regulator [Saprospiraceae bacterium]|nr:BlaI/MecI/CopY family transcriptional regulator [Saprospiraceae bacterium]MBK7525312.1 BlaI/MecI/CopY family transcriptional regulator [Saprospiraceae bacterium]MBK8372318.1 BlaI/MecI/CopY family transcriptional regulator [Saprospiraceae bacterium]MBK8547615.1 BlaI/MecI/CopY family transcriptional regulator [Saprospiraceae bacterium]MBK8820000.1 BlaI/MecI/CopY family transcriptional regulator [Saprospiraceae bacterium]
MFKPTEAELEILKVLWQHGPSTVRFVNDILNSKKDVGYTTTLKFLQIMNEKGLTIRDTDHKTHVYKAVINEADTKNRMIDDFVNNVFHGSAMNMVMQTLGNQKISHEDINDLKSIIAIIENKNINKD